MGTTKIPTEFLKSLESTFTNLINEGRPFENKLKKIRSFLYFSKDDDCIIVTVSKAEVEKLHEILGKEFKDFGLLKFSIKNEGYTTEWHWLWQNEHIVGEAFKAGYNSKEAEFTMEDMEKSFLTGFGCDIILRSKEQHFENLINSLQPLHLPASVTLNQNNEVIEVIW